MNAETLHITSDDPAFQWLDNSSLRQLFSVFKDAGYELRVVGGAVRNALMGLEVGDIDCATIANPDQVIELAKTTGIRAIPTGIDHGTVTLVIDGQAFEVTSLRADVETHGRHATVAFGRDWEEDAHRRDFTMNALYLDGQGRLYDPTGQGILDARNRMVRFIGRADKRIEEDYLRILRFFRFFAQYGKSYRMYDFEACITHKPGLAHLSAERVGAEMLKLVNGIYAPRALASMIDAGILPDLMHSAPMIARFTRLVDVCQSLNHQPSLALRLVALGLEVEEDAIRLAKAWRLPNRLRDACKLLITQMRGIDEVSKPVLQRLAYSHGHEVAKDLALLAILRRQVDPAISIESLSPVFDDIADWSVPALPISGRDLIDAGVAAGPELGRIMDRLERAWIDSGFTLGKAALLAKVS